MPIMFITLRLLLFNNLSSNIVCNIAEIDISIRMIKYIYDVAKDCAINVHINNGGNLYGWTSN
jgi:hypothetical protein